MGRTNEDLGKLITGWRKSAGLSQGALANALCTQQATISKLEAGTSRLTVVQLLAVLDACGLTLAGVANQIESTLKSDEKPLWERINE